MRCYYWCYYKYLIKEILEIMFIDILNWLKTQHSDEEVLTLKKIIKKEVEKEFD